jgi:hypothetical protein
MPTYRKNIATKLESSFYCHKIYASKFKHTNLAADMILAHG